MDKPRTEFCVRSGKWAEKLSCSVEQLYERLLGLSLATRDVLLLLLVCVIGISFRRAAASFSWNTVLGLLTPLLQSQGIEAGGRAGQ